MILSSEDYERNFNLTSTQKCHATLQIYTSKRLIKILLDLKCKDLLPPQLYWHLHASGSRTPSFYGVQKIHKPDIPLRPIVAAINSVTYQLPKHLSSILSPLMGHTNHHVKNSTDLVESIKNVRLTRNEAMASFDVESLFTSVPVNDPIKLKYKLLLADITAYLHSSQ